MPTGGYRYLKGVGYHEGVLHRISTDTKEWKPAWAIANLEQIQSPRPGYVLWANSQTIVQIKLHIDIEKCLVYGFFYYYGIHL